MEESRRSFELHGRITGKNKQAIGHARVVVWWQQIRNRVELAATESADDGRYRLHYVAPENAPERLLIVVEVLSEFLDKPLFSAITLAQPDQEIDLSIEQQAESRHCSKT